MSINDVDNSRFPRRLKTREISSDVGTSSELVNNYSLKLTFKHVEAVRKMVIKNQNVIRQKKSPNYEQIFCNSLDSIDETNRVLFFINKIN